MNNKITVQMMYRELARLLVEEQLVDFSKAVKETKVEAKEFTDSGGVIIVAKFLERKAERRTRLADLDSTLESFAELYLRPIAQELVPIKLKEGPLMVGDRVRLQNIGWVTIEAAV